MLQIIYSALPSLVVPINWSNIALIWSLADIVLQIIAVVNILKSVENNAFVWTAIENITLCWFLETIETLELKKEIAVTTKFPQATLEVFFFLGLNDVKFPQRRQLAHHFIAPGVHLHR